MRIQLENACTIVIDFQTGLMPSIKNNEDVEKNAAMFISGCKVLNIPIMVTQQYTRGLGETTDTIKQALGEFSWFEKTSFSCCGGEGFMESLEASGKKDIILTGVETHVCVMATALDLVEKGYSVYLLADCVSSRNSYDRKIAMRRMEKAGVVITTAETALFEMLRDAKHPLRKEISALVK